MDYTLYVIYLVVIGAIVIYIKQKYPKLWAKFFPTQEMKYKQQEAKVDKEIVELKSLQSLKAKEVERDKLKKDLGVES